MKKLLLIIAYLRYLKFFEIKKEELQEYKEICTNNWLEINKNKKVEEININEIEDQIKILREELSNCSKEIIKEI